VALIEARPRARRRPRPTEPAVPAFTRSWVDEFGSALAVREGRIGPRVILVVAPPEAAREALAAVLAYPDFKGRIVLAVPERVRAAPVEALLRASEARTLIAVEPDLSGLAGRGLAAPGDEGSHEASTGLSYEDVNEYPAWDGGLVVDREFPSRAASLAAARVLRAVACGPESLPAALALVLRED
jgi:hypothetical protein